MDWMRFTNPKMPVYTDTPSQGANLSDMWRRKNTTQNRTQQFDTNMDIRQRMLDIMMKTITDQNPEMSPLHRMMMHRMLQDKMMASPQGEQPFKGWM